MKRFRNISRTKKIIAAGAVAALTLGVAGTAFAYFTAGGTGTGSAPVGSAAAFTLTQVGSAIAIGSDTSTPNLYPDQASGLATGPVTSGMNAAGTYQDEIDVNVANTSNKSEYLTQVQAVVDPAFYSQNNTNLPACTPADFSLANENYTTNQPQGSPATVLWNHSFSANDSTVVPFMIEMIDNGANQDNCEGVTVPLIFTAS